MEQITSSCPCNSHYPSLLRTFSIFGFLMRSFFFFSLTKLLFPPSICIFMYVFLVRSAYRMFLHKVHTLNPGPQTSKGNPCRDQISLPFFFLLLLYTIFQNNQIHKIEGMLTLEKDLTKVSCIFILIINPETSSQHPASGVQTVFSLEKPRMHEVFCYGPKLHFFWRYCSIHTLCIKCLPENSAANTALAAFANTSISFITGVLFTALFFPFYWFYVDFSKQEGKWSLQRTN